MATDKKISQLSSGAPAQAGDEYVVARSGANYKLTLTNIAANMPATTVASGDLIVSSGNVGIGTATLSTKLDVQGARWTVSPGYQGVAFLKSTDAQAADVGAGLILGGKYDGTNITEFAQVAGVKENSTSGNYAGAMLFYTRANGLSALYERMRIDSSGNVGIGGTAEAYARVNIQGTLPTSGGTSIGFFQAGTVPSGSTGGAYCFHTNLNTQAASFTCANFYHYSAYQNSIGAGSTVTNQYGYFADATLTGATNNYGFYSNIASGSNRWNFYAAGTANNYFAGNVGIGTTSPTTKVYVAGAGTTKTSYANGDAAGATLCLQDTGASSGNGGQILFGSAFGLSAGIKSFVTNGTGPAGDLLFQTRASSGDILERMRITSVGKVLVGTTTPVGSSAVVMYLSAGGETWQLGPEANGNFAVTNDADVGVYVQNGQTAWSSTSDERIKTDLVPIADALNKVSSLRTVTGRYIKDAVGTSRSFLIAQDVQAVFPEAVDVPKKESDPLGLRYTDVVPLLVAAIKELSAKVAALEEK